MLAAPRVVYVATLPQMASIGFLLQENVHF
jgi:hypothetical protein